MSYSGKKSLGIDVPGRTFWGSIMNWYRYPGPLARYMVERSGGTFPKEAFRFSKS